MKKMLKALLTEKTKSIPPKSHNLPLLAKKSGIYIKLDNETKKFLADLQLFNIEGHYPIDRLMILNTTPKSVFRELYTKTQEVIKWMENYLISERK